MRYVRQSLPRRSQPIDVRLTEEQWPTEARIRHLELVQSIVTRLATSSFVAKGWALTVAGAIYGFAANHLNPWIASVGLLPTLGFWWLDAYFLLHERLFRCLYNDAHQPSTSVGLFSMNIAAYKKGRNTTWPNVFFSITLAIFYGMLVLVGLILMVVGIVHHNNYGSQLTTVPSGQTRLVASSVYLLWLDY